MKQLILLHHKITAYLQKRSVKISLSCFFVAAVAAILAPLLVATYTIHQQRSDLYDILTGADQRIVAQQLEETGFVELRGQLVGDERLKGFRILDQDGIVVDPSGITSIILQNEFPQWVPLWLLQDTDLTWAIGAITLASLLLAVWIGLFAHLCYSLFVALSSWYIFQALHLPLPYLPARRQ